MFLQTYVVPACLYIEDGGAATLKELIGSVFFINNEGIFLTAKHVMEGGISKAREKNMKFGLCVKADHGKSLQSLIAEIINNESANNPFDISIGRVNHGCETLLTLSPINIEVWQDVAAYGYPLITLNISPSDFQINMRCHKGYIQRIIKPGDIHIGDNPDAFETSFLLGKGLSGSPLFVHRQPKDIVIGVCVGSIRTEIIDYEHVEVDENGNKYKESRLKIEEFGIAHDIRPLHNWRPNLLGGLTLLEATQQ